MSLPAMSNSNGILATLRLPLANTGEAQMSAKADGAATKKRKLVDSSPPDIAESTGKGVAAKGETVLVLHIGSKNVRFGFPGSDPVMIPAVVARRRTPHTPATDALLPRQRSPSIKADIKAVKRRLYTEQLLIRAGIETFDERNSVSEIQLPEDEPLWKWTDYSKGNLRYVGDEALRLPPGAPYITRELMSHGRIGVGPDYPMSQAMADIRAVVAHALEKLGYTPAAPTCYSDVSVVLIVPDQVCKRDLAAMMNCLLSDMSCCSVLLYQESVCAAFGFGLTTACVVDIGDQKISVSCVEDGISVPPSRITVNYGGKDITELLHWMLEHSKRHFYPLQGRNIRVDPQCLHMLTSLKESLCHLDKETRRMEIFTCTERRLGQKPLMYNFNASDELLLAPMALFHPAMLEPIEPKRHLPAYDLADEFGITTPWPRGEEIDHDAPRPLDVLILDSISAVGRKEARKRLCNTVLLVGGGSLFEGLRGEIEERLAGATPPEWDVDRVHTLGSTRKNIQHDPHLLSWRGGAIVCELESTDSLWISSEEWLDSGMKAVLEKGVIALG